MVNHNSLPVTDMTMSAIKKYPNNHPTPISPAIIIFPNNDRIINISEEKVYLRIITYNISTSYNYRPTELYVYGITQGRGGPSANIFALLSLNYLSTNYFELSFSSNTTNFGYIQDYSTTFPSWDIYRYAIVFKINFQ